MYQSILSILYAHTLVFTFHSNTGNLTAVHKHVLGFNKKSPSKV